MLFQKGDWYEVAGGRSGEVFYADEEIFVARDLNQTCGGTFDHLSFEMRIYSNKGDPEGLYWVRKIPPKKLPEVDVSVPVMGAGR